MAGQPPPFRGAGRETRFLSQGQKLRAAVAAADVLASVSVPQGRCGQGRWHLHTAASQEGSPELREPRSGKTGRTHMRLRPEGRASLRPTAAAVQTFSEGRLGAGRSGLCWGDMQGRERDGRVGTRQPPEARRPPGTGHPCSGLGHAGRGAAGSPQSLVLPGVRLSGP